MQPQLVMKQNTTSGQVGLQTGMVTVPMRVNSSMAGSMPNVMTTNKPGGNNVVFALQNLAPPQPAILSNVQTLNMHPGGATVPAQKSVIETRQVGGTRGTAPGITLQTLQSLQQGQQGHLLLKTESGQYQLVRVGPAPASTLTAPQQTLRLSNVPAQPPDNTKEKCRNFLANLLDLSTKEPIEVEGCVRNLIQQLIDAQVEPEEFCNRLEKLLNASPQPSLIRFLENSLPLLRQSLVTKEVVMDGINPPSPHVAFSPLPAPSAQDVPSNNINLQKPQPKAGGKITILQNIPVHTKINMGKVGKTMSVNSKTFTRSTSSAAALATVLTARKPLVKEQEKTSGMQIAAQPFAVNKMAGNDDFNDVAAMGGVNLAEESQRILGSTDMIGSQIRSCKDEYLIPPSTIQARLKAVVARHGLKEPSGEVAAILSLALHERLKNIAENLAVIAQHRMDMLIKTDSRYEVTQDVKGQLKFLEELDEAKKKRREDSEREMLLRAAKSRSKNEDPERAKLKAKAKEMQRAELEELRQREANLTALQAIGPRKKPRLDGAGDSLGPANHNTGFTGRSLPPLRRLKRVNHRDMTFLLEQGKDTARSAMLYRSYLK